MLTSYILGSLNLNEYQSFIGDANMNSIIDTFDIASAVNIALGNN